ncbi:related to n-terminal acetyltransferase 1 [Serendipita indica DSM 11827]|uniref:Related to n-terminal acetyltransferase 1 n=1 Tax=Serendipita indica (strain DSM 11827) TaxID=1109443 RepID=G4U2S3_SERID|nr:related to n-terminal acetyltransferase 1 [Serendipita indica DSM 11827]
MPPSKPAPLPPKEAALFKTLLSQYESRQLKKAIKTADQILKKVGDHGETISMKGLVLSYQGKREEGMELVKKGLRLDLSSHICWHVCGLVHKQDKNYDEALKCYAQALKYDPANMNILRDAANLQAQLRLFDGLENSRLTILKLRMNLKQNWVALAVAYALNGNWKAAQSLLDELLTLVKEVPAHDNEYSELLLFYLTVLERNQEYGEALKKLSDYTEAKKIVDNMHAAIIRPRLLQKLSRTEEALAEYKVLIARNPDCYEFYRLYLECLGLSLDEPSEKVIEELEAFASEFPTALVPRRLLLTVTTDERFQSLAKEYVIRGLKKNIPSLFVDLKPLYKDDAKRSTIQAIVEEYHAGLEKESSSTEPDRDSPTTYVWTLYYLGLHYSSCGDFQRADEIFNTALQHTPTLPELYMAKARNLKRAGDLVGAVAMMDAAVELDGQDRFLNTKCATYHLRNGEVEEAQRLFGLFTKKDATSPGKDLEDMQSFKFLLEDGQAHLKINRLALALKRFRTIERIFSDLHEDQFDFHSFCIRRFTLNIYFDIIQWDDRLRWHPIFVRAIVNAANIYIRLFDTPGLAAEQTAPLPQPEEVKQSKKQAKKAKMKAAEEAKKAAAEKEKENEEVLPAFKDDDPDGHKAISVEDPLEQAANLLQPFAARNHDLLDVWLVTYDVAIRRKKVLQALRALEAAKRINPTSPQLHYRLIDFQLAVPGLAEGMETVEAVLLKDGLAKLAPGEQPPALQNSQYLQEHSSDAAAVIAVARAAHKIGSSEETEAHLFTLLADQISLNPQHGLEALKLLEDIKSTRMDEFRDGCKKKLPLSTVFLPSEELEALRKKYKTSETNDGPENSQEKDQNDALLIEPSST